MNKILISIFFILFAGAALYAQIPRKISYQGVLTDNTGKPKPDGDYSISFRFYENETGGNPIWSESKTLTITKGLLSTSLGDQTPFGSNVKFDKQYFLGIKIGDEAELAPRIALTSSGYSITSDKALDVVGGKVVKSINDLKDNVTLEGAGGTTINTNGNTITISSSSGSGTGIQEIQNTNNTLDITSANGPTATVNLKVPLVINDSTNNMAILHITNHGYSEGIYASADYSAAGAVWGKNITGNGVIGESGSGRGVLGFSQGNGIGVVGNSYGGIGIDGNSYFETAVNGYSSYGTGVKGETGQGNYGVYGRSPTGVGVGGESNGYALWGNGLGEFGIGIYAFSENSVAGLFAGDIEVNGTLSKSAGSFKIDHPLDPSNKYLYHSFVESPDMKNIYDGVVTTDANGSAVVILPEWFEALNKEFRYQLTVLGQFAQAIIESEIQNNHFSIKTDNPDVKVSWQVTGIRKDAFAEKYRIPVEEFKTDKERGKYLHPELFGQQKEMGINFLNLPEVKKNPLTIDSEPLKIQLSDPPRNLESEILRRKNEKK